MDKKALLVAGAIMAVIGGITAVAYNLLIDRSTTEEYSAVSTARKIEGADGAAGQGMPDFPTKHRGGEAPPSDWEVKKPNTKASSSLGFVQGNEDAAPGSPHGSSSQSASEAAGALDAKGVIKGLREDGGDIPDAGSGKLSDKVIRGIMQEVVDGVHQMQPEWYEEFLANKYLKRFADDYDKSNDFESFLESLGKSKAFRAMLTEHSKTREMRALTKEMFKNGSLKNDLMALFFQVQDNPHVTKLVSLFGRKAGLPNSIVKTAESKAPQKAPSAKKQHGKTRSQRPTLKPVSYGGFGDSKPQGGMKSGGGKTHTPQKSPTGFDPSQIPPEYRGKVEEYMKKK